jgi:hypothetical protein
VCKFFFFYAAYTFQSSFLIPFRLFCVTVKPKEFAVEELDPSDPDSMYFMYVCKKTTELVIKKKIKLGRMTKKQIKGLKRRPYRVNVKPSNN